MNFNSKITTALNIKEGEGNAIIFLMLISFFMGTAIAFFYTATTSMFLAVYSTQMLPYAYIGSGIIGYLIWKSSSRLNKKITLPSMLVVYLSFLTVSVMFFFAGVEFSSQTWIPFLMFIWIRVFTYINAIVFWTLAGTIFDLRQGKRLFGLISAGEVISTIIGFFSIPFLLLYIEVPDLILISLAGLILCLIVSSLTIKKYREKLLVISSAGKSSGEHTVKSFASLFKKKYFKYMFILAIIPMFSIYFVDFIFLTQTKIEYPDKNFIAGFLGIFFGIAAIVEFFIKTFLSGRIISRYGLKAGLTALPAMMLFSTALAAAAGSIFGAVGLLYSFIALTKFSERVLRSSLGEPTFQILYQPLPAEERLTFQNRIEGGPKALGTIAGGVTLLIFTNLSFLNIIHYNYLFLILLVYWIKVSLNMYLEYRESLKKLIDNKSRKALTSAEDSSDLTDLFQDLVSGNPKNLPLIFSLYERINPIKAEASLIRLLMQSNVNIGPGILRNISANKYLGAVQVFEYCMADEELQGMKKELEDALQDLKYHKEISFKELCRMSDSLNPEEREIAARLLGYSSKYNAVTYIKKLIKDQSPIVSRTALISAGRIKRSELWDDIIEALGVSSLSTAATSAIRNIGTSILPDLEKFVSRTAIPKSLLKRVIRIYGNIGGENAAKYLVKRIAYPDRDIREEVFVALSKMGFQASAKDMQILKETIKEEIGIIIWIMAAISDIEAYPDTQKLEAALRNDLRLKKDVLFAVLSLLYDTRTIQLVRESINSANPTSRTYGLEIIDLMISSDIKDILIPLLEENTILNYLDKYKEIYPQQRFPIDQRLENIINKEYDKISIWVKTCAVELVPEYNNSGSHTLLAANVMCKDELLREASVLALSRFSPDSFTNLIKRLPEDQRGSYSSLHYKIQIGELNDLFFLSGKIRVLKEIPELNETNENILKEIVLQCKEVYLQKDEFLNLSNDTESNTFFILAGTVMCNDGSIIARNNIISVLFMQAEHFRAVEDCLLLQIDDNLLFELMADFPEFARCILMHINSKTILD